MAEKILICNALDERDFLRQKIESQISGINVVGACRKKDSKVDGKLLDDFIKEAKSSYQSITDLIDRWRRLDTNITQANAETMVELKSGKKMTRARAIALRNSLKNVGRYSTDFEGMLLERLKQQYCQAVQKEAAFNRNADEQLISYKDSLLSRQQSKELSESEVKLAETMVEKDYGVLIDPIDVEEKIKVLNEEHMNLLAELETAIKVSNATTYIEI